MATGIRPEYARQGKGAARRATPAPQTPRLPRGTVSRGCDVVALRLPGLGDAAHDRDGPPLVLKGQDAQLRERIAQPEVEGIDRPVVIGPQPGQLKQLRRAYLQDPAQADEGAQARLGRGAVQNAIEGGPV